MLALNTILQNRYRVVRKLSEGGIGMVYEALDQRLNCIVALKETTAGDDEGTRRAFEREASLLGNLRHPALPKVMDYFNEGDRDYLVMEFIPGHDLAELLELRGSPFPQAQVMRWSDQLLGVLEYLHGQQPAILHRDIKPSNLKLTEQGEIFLLDFGLAKGTAGQMPTLMTSRSVRGYTPVYASLEQIHGHGTDPRSDLYSLAATCYHLLTGVPPTDAPTRFNAIDEEQHDPLLPADQVNPEMPHALATVLASAMAMNRRERPASAGEMRRQLREATASQLSSYTPTNTLSKGPAPALLPTQTASETGLLPPARQPRPTESSRPTVEPAPREPTIEEVPNLIHRPRLLQNAVLPDADSDRSSRSSRYKTSLATLVLLSAGGVVLVLTLGWLVLPLLTSRSQPGVQQNQAVASTSPSVEQKQSSPSPSPTPLIPRSVPVPRTLGPIIEALPEETILAVDLNGDGGPGVFGRDWSLRVRRLRNRGLSTYFNQLC
jgi:serine/threonine protein kinase